MGIRKFWKPPKDMTAEESKELRQQNGARAVASEESQQRKFKFDSFKSYASNQPKKTFNPIVPQEESANTSGGAYSSYDDVNGGNDNYSAQNGYNPYQSQQPSTNNRSYSYQQSIQNNSSSSAGYSYDPYGDTQSKPSTSNFNSYSPYGSESTSRVKKSRTNIASEYDRQTITTESDNYNSYDPYGDANQLKSKDTSGADGYDNQTIATNNNYNSYDPYGDVKTAKTGITSDMQQLQLKEQEEPIEETEFDPYGPAAKASTTATTNEMDFNNYAPAEFDEFQDYDQDEFTQEIDEDEAELARITRQTKDLREDTVNVSSNIVNNLKQGNSTAINTLGVLGAQREKIYSMDKKMNNIEDVQEDTTEHIKQLDHYRRPLYHIKINNPLTKGRRARAKEAALDRKLQQQDAREDATNSNLYSSQQALVNQFKDPTGETMHSDLQKKYDYERRIKEAQRYLTSDHDEEDANMENKIAQNLEDALKEAERMKSKAIAMSEEISKQNQDLQNMSERTTKANHRVLKSTTKLRGI